MLTVHFRSTVHICEKINSKTCTHCRTNHALRYPSTAAPRYRNAFIVNICMMFMTIVVATVIRMDLARLNRKLDRGEAVKDVNVARMDTAAREKELEEHGLSEAVEHGFRFLL